MSDTSKMTPEEYAKHVEGLATKTMPKTRYDNCEFCGAPNGDFHTVHCKRPMPSPSTGESSSCEFKPGQVVWRETTGEKCRFLATFGPFAWIEFQDRHTTVPIGTLTGTDPNQPVEPVPQKCPQCERESIASVYRDGDQFDVRHSCGAVSARKPTRLEAILAWNSLGNVTEEREACAKIAERVRAACVAGASGDWASQVIAKDIRSRGQQ